MNQLEDEPLDLLLEDDEPSEIENKYLVVELSDSRYGVPISDVREIISMPKITDIPGKKQGMRGIIKVREENYPLMDMRTLFNLPSLEQEDGEMIEMMAEREKDHIAWMDELIASVRDKREFRLTTDPHECKFGQWYYSFHTDSLDLSIYLSNFEIPHKRIHDVGKKVQESVKRNDYDEAERIIDSAKKNELKMLVELFKEAPEQIKNSHRELAVIIEKDDSQFAVSADKVVGIAEFPEEKIEKKRMADKSKVIKGVANAKDYTCLIIDIDKIFTD